MQVGLAFLAFKLPRDVLVDMALNAKKHQLFIRVRVRANCVHLCFTSLETPSKARSASVPFLNESSATLT